MKKISLILGGLVLCTTLTAFAQTQEPETIQVHQDEDYVTVAYLDERLESFEQELLKEPLIRNKDEDVPLPEKKVEVSQDDDAVIGSKDAPVTMIGFVDFECPHCASFANTTLYRLKEKYADTGKLKIIVRDFPLEMHENAKNASMAAECLRDQGGDEMYWSYINILFQNQMDLSIEGLKTYAKLFEINQEEFEGCLVNETYKEEVEKDILDGITYGVEGTPASFINGRLITGDMPYELYEAVIEDEISKKL